LAKVILSLDGGGIRGAATTQFLMRLEERLQGLGGVGLRDCVDLYAGTSTGAIIALALGTTDLPLLELNALYGLAHAQQIFAENRGWFEIDGVNAPRYEGTGKTAVLADRLGEARLGDVPPDKHVLAVAYAVEQRKPAVLKSTEPAHRDLLSWQVADASSAAPTYFPTRPLALAGDERWLVDGGVTANNPTLCALAEVRRAWPDLTPNEIRVLSVGTGYRTRKINGPASQRWGALWWIAQGQLLDLVMDERVVAYQAMSLLPDGAYIRVNAELSRQPGLPAPPDDAMDDVSEGNIRRLKTLGDFWFERYGDAAAALLLGTYDGPSLDRIDRATGQPRPGAA
jgi:uncharacterized protein